MVSNVRRAVSLPAAVCLLMLALTACSQQAGESSGGESGSGESLTAEEMMISYGSEELDDTWDSDSAAVITLEGGSASLLSSGTVGTPPAIGDGLITISKAGTYVFSGSLDDGQIVVDAGKGDTVRLVLNGASISCSDGPAVYSRQAGLTVVILADGTDNTLTDGAEYADTSDDAPTAALFSQDDLAVTGSGSLSVTGNHLHGIATKDRFTLSGGTLYITAVQDGLRGRDAVAVCGGALTIEAGGDGIKANNDEDTERGWISLEGGTFVITAGTDGIQAETVLQISGGSYTLTTGGGSQNSSTDSVGEMRPGWGKWGGFGQGPGGENDTGTVTEDSASAKGLKAGTALYIDAGTFTVDSSDDSIHCNGSVSIRGGTLSLSSGDDGIHADGALALSGGEVTVSKSYEGLEGASVTVSGGTYRVTASDDGVNAAGGSDGSSLNGRPGKNSFQSGGDYFIRITGGVLTVTADGDGLDSNGALTIEGGTVIVEGPTSGADGALDYDGTCTVSGGILVAMDSGEMAQYPGSGSTQNSLAVTYTASQSAGTAFALTAEDGSVVVSYTPSKSYRCVCISTPELTRGASYTLYRGGACSGQGTEGLITGGTLSGGTELTQVTLSSAATSISSDGGTVSAGQGMGGGQFPGGNGAGRGFGF